MLYFLQRLRIIVLLAIFGTLYKWVDPMWAFIFILFFVLSDMTDIEEAVNEMKEGKEPWKPISMRRKSF